MTIYKEMGKRHMEYSRTAIMDIENAKKMVMSSVNFKKPVGYHTVHLEIELSELKSLKPVNQRILKLHIDGHKLALKLKNNPHHKKKKRGK
ncbi:MAG: hypothetical protein ACFFG0_20760 [Candidatus Thorarchaeota archaeon]